MGSRFFNTAIFYAIGFSGIVPNEILQQLILWTYLLEIMVALLDTPIVYLVVYWLVGSWTAKGNMKPERAIEKGGWVALEVSDKKQGMASQARSSTGSTAFE